MPPKKRKSEHEKAVGGLPGESCASAKEETRNSDSGVAQHTFAVPHNGKEIVCERHGRRDGHPELAFTHGAGGGLANSATKCFVEGFSRISPAISFQGTMNLHSRVKSFHAVIEHEDVDACALGGRSMGARAAVLAASDHSTKHLVLVSYPLVGQNGQVRDEILLNIHPTIKVLFISGSNDNMCAIDQLDEVRAKMKAKSWLAVVQGADHGMSLKPKNAVDRIRVYTGELAARWVENGDTQRTECVIRWDVDESEVVDEGWKKSSKTSSVPAEATAKVKEDTREDQDDDRSSRDQRPSKRRKKR